MQEDVKEFLENFDIADNALQMRCLNRWNGRDLREKENLAEHTHLVCACSIKLYDFFILFIYTFYHNKPRYQYITVS